MSGQPRIFVGVEEIADHTLMLSRGLRALGYQVRNVVLEQYKPAFRENNALYDRVLPHRSKVEGALALLTEFLRSAWRHDVFIFVNGGSFTSHLLLVPGLRWLAYVDLRVLRLLGKRVAIITNGSDVRSPKRYVEELQRRGLHTFYLELPPETWGDEPKRRRVARIEKLAHVIFSFPLDALLLQRPYARAWVPLDLGEFSKAPKPARAAPLIVHAPSKAKNKGTEHVLAAVERLRKEGLDFEFRLCTGMSNRELRRLLCEADIAIDQFEPMYGLFAVESMAAGCVVLNGAIAGYHWPEDCPIFTTTPANLTENLRRLIQDPELRAELGERSRAYAARHHDHVEVARKTMAALAQV